MKIILWIVIGIFSLIAAIVFYFSLHDEYIVLKQEVSPDGKRVAVLIGNHGGGGAGYCRDLIYSFPNSENLPVITSNWAESRNKEHLVKVAFCDNIQELRWENKELTWKNKGLIPDY